MKSTILALDTATNACSASLYVSENRFLHRFALTQREHTRMILPMIDALLQEADLLVSDIDAVAVSQGPGSFTGVRIAIGVAQGLGFALNKPIYPISTLEALAYQGIELLGKFQNRTIVPAIDARMQEIYAALYHWDQKERRCVKTDFLASPAELVALLGDDQSVIAIGSGWDVYQNLIPSNIQCLPQCCPQAKHIALIAKEQIEQGLPGVKAENLLPAYIRDKVALNIAERASLVI